MENSLPKYGVKFSLNMYLNFTKTRKQDFLVKKYNALKKLKIIVY